MIPWKTSSGRSRIGETARILFLCIFFLFFSPALLQGQSTAGASAALPDGFGELRFGMTVDEAKEALKGDPNFDFRGDPDVTLLLRPNEKAIDTRGVGFVERGFFQFHEGRLYLIHMLLREDEMDHYTMYRTLVEKYGEPTHLDPEVTYWEDERTRIALERPLGVKYIWKQAFEAISEESNIRSSIQSMYRDSFLDQF